jgi:hypothetical protein
MMEQKTRNITMRSYLKRGIDETLIASSIENRVRMALENVPEWVVIPEVDKDECVTMVASKIPVQYGAT